MIFIKPVSAWLSVELAIHWPSRFNISEMKKLNKILLSSDQLYTISKTVLVKRPCRLLVFGLGNDSIFWHKLNRKGKTVFLEDNEEWIKKVTGKLKTVNAYHVDYKTRRKDWKELLESPELLDIELPEEVKKQKWDVILVDAPQGWSNSKPGRMKSIFLSSRLVDKSGDVFVHDCNREVEDVYSHRFLNKRNMKQEIKSVFGDLRHYRMNSYSS